MKKKAKIKELKQEPFQLFLCVNTIKDTSDKIIYNSGQLVLVTSMATEFAPHFVAMEFVKGEFKVKQIKAISAKKIAKK